MEFYLDLLLYAPYVTATLLCLVTYCFYLESKQIMYQSRTLSTSIDKSVSTVHYVNGKRKKLFTFVFRKRPTKEANKDEEEPSFY
ncbi:hypothetical protein [Sutcliffiella halmapala]|uniref:hypothetical protein n=1 Tax=Sutcliffiella halmapala TaxID=79882 RepID=UPI000995D3C7|nr:hypothetical protein [Sutcliffiella halmapala]